MTKTKKEGQVFTPPSIVKEILNRIGFVGTNCLTKKIIEPSFGNGAFLIEILDRIISFAQENNISDKVISKIISENVWGIEKDPDLYQEAVEKIQELYKTKGLNIELPHLICGDTIVDYPQLQGVFDFVVGNPPYVRIHNIDSDVRTALNSLKFCKGNTDLYIAFFEIGLLLLNHTGRLGYITPNSFLRNSSQRKFRNYLLDNHLISYIHNFKQHQVFDDALVYACICGLDKQGSNLEFYYGEGADLSVPKETLSVAAVKELFSDRGWCLGKSTMQWITDLKKRPHSIQEFATVQNAISTNADGLYTGNAYLDKNGTKSYVGRHTDPRKLVYFNGHQIESDILHRCVKCSTYSGDIKNHYILYPYKKTESGVIPIDETTLKTSYPLAYNYLLKHKAILEVRDMDRNTPWYAFARNQGLAKMDNPKLVFKHINPVDADKIDVHALPPDVVVYAGLFVTCDKIEDLYRVKNILESKDFARWCGIVGQTKAGGYAAIGSKDVKDFRFD